MLLSSCVGVSWKYKSAEILMTKRSLDVYNISLKCSNHRKRTWEEESLQTFWKVNLWVHQKPSFLKRKEKFFHRLYVENQIHIFRYSKKSHLIFKNKKSETPNCINFKGINSVMKNNLRIRLRFSQNNGPIQLIISINLTCSLH